MKKRNIIILLQLIITCCISLIVISCSCSHRCKFRTNFKAGDYNSCRFGECGSSEVCQTQQRWPIFKIFLKINNQWKEILYNTGYWITKEGHSPWINGYCISNDEQNGIQDFKILSISSPGLLVKGTISRCFGKCIKYKTDYRNVRYTLDDSECGVNIDIDMYPFKKSF